MRVYIYINMYACENCLYGSSGIVQHDRTRVKLCTLGMPESDVPANRASVTQWTKEEWFVE